MCQTIEPPNREAIQGVVEDVDDTAKPNPISLPIVAKNMGCPFAVVVVVTAKSNPIILFVVAGIMGWPFDVSKIW